MITKNRRPRRVGYAESVPPESRFVQTANIFHSRPKSISLWSDTGNLYRSRVDVVHNRLENLRVQYTPRGTLGYYEWVDTPIMDGNRCWNLWGRRIVRDAESGFLTHHGVSDV